MRKVLVLGAGRSSPALIDYLIGMARREEWEITVADFSRDVAAARVAGRQAAQAVAIDIKEDDQRNNAVRRAHVVISLLPPALHYLVAMSCVRYGKHLLTASYVTPQLMNLNKEATAAGILLMNECGLDPGIDHMSVMDGIEQLRKDGCRLTGLKSFAGGLIAPESNDNPWGYKFTWNPGNVIRAGQGTARFIKDGKIHFQPNSRIFEGRDQLNVGGLGKFDAYANRDSLAYRRHYRIKNIDTLIRGTLRHIGFCRAWNVFVRLGLTDDTFIVENSRSMTYAGLVDAFIPHWVKGRSVSERLAAFFNLKHDSEIMEKIRWTGILGNVRIPVNNATPAAILQQLLERKWKFKKSDRDMVVMLHLFEFEREVGVKQHKKGRRGVLKSWMCLEGESHRTAMAKTVGLPLGIVARLLLAGKIKSRGVRIPVMKELYVPALAELSSHGIKFTHSLEH